jgi:hypothetical protein
MKRAIAYMTAFCLVLYAVAAYSGTQAAFAEQRMTITRNGADTSGRVFERADDPAVLLVLSGDSAYLVNRSAKTVHSVAINGINDAANPVMIDYGVLSRVEGAGLIVGSDEGVAFLARGDRYAVTPQGRGYPGPD